MIIIDTNIISELMKPTPSSRVILWLDQQEVTQLFITTITIAEIAYGLHTLPQGNRRNSLEDIFNTAIMEAFTHRILAFDQPAAYQYGKIMAHRKEIGRPLGVPDGQICAIAHNNNAMIATRNIRDFENCGIKLVNPFEALAETQQ